MAIQIRRGTNSQWTQLGTNVVVGEPVIVTDTKRFLVGTASGTATEFANMERLASTYDSTDSYIVGECCIYNGKVYQCVSPTSGSWSASKWQEVTMADSVLTANDYLELANLMASAYDSSATYFEGEFCKYSGNVYECNSAITTAESWDATHWDLIGSAS